MGQTIGLRRILPEEKLQVIQPRCDRTRSRGQRQGLTPGLVLRLTNNAAAYKLEAPGNEI
jgi:hypothetical protein